MLTKKSIDLVREITKKIPSFHHHYHILYDIANSINKKIINYVEIGAYGGASAILMLHNKNVKATSIDIGHPIKKEKVLENISMFFKDNRFNYIQGDSHDPNVKKQITEKIDVLFIDGDHSFNGVTKDFEDYSPLVEKNGYIILDDYFCPESIEVKPAVDAIVSKLNFKEFLIIGNFPNQFDAKPDNLKLNNCFVIRKI
jgi:predicted O-methyltransferase YrrM